MTIAKQIKWDFGTNGDLVIKDKNGNFIYYENRDGLWWKSEYDSDGKEIYFENSNGTIRDNRPKAVPEYTMEEAIALIGHNFKLKK